MYFPTVLVALCLFYLQTQNAANAACCIPREPCVYLASGCPATMAGVVSCSYCDCEAPPSTTACCGCNSCFRSTKNPCDVCPEKPSPVCSCFNALNGGSCGSCGSSSGSCGSCGSSSGSCGSSCGSCGGCSGCANRRIYFPEVEYPNTCIEMNPFYFANCFTF